MELSATGQEAAAMTVSDESRHDDDRASARRNADDAEERASGDASRDTDRNAHHVDPTDAPNTDSAGDGDDDAGDDGDGDGADEINLVVRAAMLFEGLILLGAWLVGEIVERPPLGAIAWSWPAAWWGLAAATLMLVTLLAVMRTPFRPAARFREFCDELLVPMFRGAAWWELAVISVLAGFGEEMLFRGVVQHGLAKAIGSPAGIWVGLFIASLTFGLAHFVNRTYAVMAGVVGLYFGLLFIFTENLLAPIVAHAVYDFGAFLLLLPHGRAKLATSANGSASHESGDESPGDR